MGFKVLSWEKNDRYSARGFGSGGTGADSCSWTLLPLEFLSTVVARRHICDRSSRRSLANPHCATGLSMPEGALQAQC